MNRHSVPFRHVCQTAFFRGISLALVALLLFAASGCGGKKGSGKYPASGVICQDVLTLPQNLNTYASAAGGNRTLAPAALQAAAAAEQKDSLYRPWRMTEASRWVKQSLDKNFSMKLENAYTDNRRPFPSSTWAALEENSNKRAYPSQEGKGITLRHTNLRAMPTSMPYYLDPDKPGEGFPFDYFQQTSLPMGTPLYICNISKDESWILVETALAAGWLPVADVAGVDDAFVERWQHGGLAALVRDRVAVGSSSEHAGTLLPLASGSAPSGLGNALSILFPVRGNDGKARAESVSLAPGDAVAVPLALSPANIALIGNGMMGQAYGWGGLMQLRDCSALTRDLYAPFGVWLPRNSARQAGVGRPIALTGMGNAEKEAVIVREAVPFASLLWLRGHIAVYLGTYQGKPVMFHNMWGLRTRDSSGSCDGRAVVGKAVVTSLRPGSERPDLCSGLLDRIERAIVLP